MMNMIVNFWVTRAIHSAAFFGIADHLKHGPQPIGALAAATGTHPGSLERLLRALSSVGIFLENADGTYSSTPMSATLESDAPGSLRYFAMAELGQEHYAAWEDFPHSIATGDMAFQHKFKMPVWEYYAKHPHHAAVFNNSMSKLTESVEAAVIAAYDFNHFKKIVDIGGGHGQFLTSILKACPQSTGVLFDASEVVSKSPVPFEKVAGNFFGSVPSGGDAYTLKWILHDWNDAECITILKNIARAMNKDGRVAIVEIVIPPGNEPQMGKWLDLNMLVMTGGRERTAAEFEHLLSNAGLEMVRIVPTDSPFSVVEGKLKGR